MVDNVPQNTGLSVCGGRFMRSFDAVLKITISVCAGRLANRRIGFVSIMALAVFAVIAAASAPAAAVVLNRGSDAPIYVTPQAMIDSARQTAEAVSDAVNSRLAPAPSAPNPVVLQYAAEGIADPAADAFGALDGEFAATGDFASTNQAVLLWNLWSDATVAFADRNIPIAGYDGALVTVSLGLDRKVGDRS
ncbi:MAG: hypothetical protein OEL78_09220, partial [Hyphomicrobiales bacterium]|nr:hypothetical protein [Hyphomicrobiales bacterium]